MRGNGLRDKLKTAGPLFDSLPARQTANRDRVARQCGWATRYNDGCDSHGLLAIAAGVLGVITALSVLLVFAGYLFVAP